MNTFLARTGSNSTCFLAIKQSLPCGCVQFRGACASSAPLDPAYDDLDRFCCSKDHFSILGIDPTGEFLLVTTNCF